MENLEVFRKGAKYRLHLDKSIAIRGSEVRDDIPLSRLYRCRGCRSALMTCPIDIARHLFLAFYQ